MAPSGIGSKCEPLPSLGPEVVASGAKVAEVEVAVGA